MKRRALLGTLAATAFAGCTGVYGGGTDPTDPATTDEPSTNRTDAPTNASDELEFDASGDNPYLLADVRGDPAPVEGLEIDVTATRNFTADHPAALRVAVTNTADEAREFEFGSLVPWDELRGDRQDGEGALLLDPGTNVVPDEPDGDCWRATSGVALPMVMKSATLDPGETRGHEFRVLAAPDGDDCPWPGTFRVHDPGYLGEGWGFTVDVDYVVPVGDANETRTTE